MTAAAAWEEAGDVLPEEIVATLESSNDETLRDLNRKYLDVELPSVY